MILEIQTSKIKRNYKLDIKEQVYRNIVSCGTYDNLFHRYHLGFIDSGNRILNIDAMFNRNFEMLNNIKSLMNILTDRRSFIELFNQKGFQISIHETQEQFVVQFSDVMFFKRQISLFISVETENVLTIKKDELTMSFIMTNKELSDICLILKNEYEDYE